MERIYTVLVLVVLSFTLNAQVLTPERITSWQNAGLTIPLTPPENQVNILDLGADLTGSSSCNAAYAAAIQTLNGAAGTVYFPTGTYFFDAAISIPDSVFIVGEAANTTLRFNLNGSGNLIVMNGAISNTQHALETDALKGSYAVELSDASDFAEGDVLRLGCFDEDYMYSSWAYGTLGQVLIISEKVGNTLYFEDPLNHHYTVDRQAYARKITPRVAAGISCVKIERMDATASQTSNIYIRGAINCLVQNVESVDCNFGHVEVNSSAHIQVRGSYFHHAHAYGGGGQGYGVVFQESSSFNLAENNIFEHLRHSMLLQSGANGNVCGYNYSYDPYWVSGFLPNNSAGDAVLHGNYVFLNLFEGNTIQNIVVDASHGSNGPYNTFFRNRAELYGFFSDSGTPTDSMNVVGNEITNSGWPYGMYSVNGAGHYTFGNNVNGTVNPANTTNIATQTLYLDESTLPYFFQEMELPMVGYPLVLNEKQLDAESRFESQEYVNCTAEQVMTSATALDETNKLWIADNTLYYEGEALPLAANLYSLTGQLISTFNITSNAQPIPGIKNNGIYVLRIEDDSTTYNLRFLAID